MRFIDEAKISIAGGHGGPGCVSFRRETFEPRGGPDGGDGGAGGDVIFISSAQLSTLQDFRFKRIYQAPNGKHGSGTNKAGRDGEDITIHVPVGTVIRDLATNDILFDFTLPSQEWVACHGGRGGKGNAHFVSSTFQAPKFAQPGEEGESKEISLELKLLADAGIIGFPNAGKSTLISRISAARPKIADYPFTTLTPNLGVVQMPDLQSFVVADIPGLVEGAHSGMGLGHKFLKHIERTSLFIHVLDGSKLLEDVTRPEIEDSTESMNASIELLIERYEAIRKELGLFNEKLLHKPEIVVLNKVDLLDSSPEFVEKARLALRQRLTSIRGIHPIDQEPFVISCVSGKGIEELLFVVYQQIKIQRNSQGPGAKNENTPPLLPDDKGIRR